MDVSRPETFRQQVRRTTSTTSAAEILRRLKAFYDSPSTSDQDRTRCLQYVASLYHVTHDVTQNASLDQPPLEQQHPQQQTTRRRSHSVAADRIPQPLNHSGKTEHHCRPHTVMATVGFATNRYGRDPYETSYSRDFNRAPTFVMTTDSFRPSTTFAAINKMPAKCQEMHTTYGDDYQIHADVSRSKAHPIYPLNGEQRNNPHPLQPFIVWRMPRSGLTYREPISDITHEMPDALVKDTLKSIHQTDYVETSPQVISRARKSVRLTLDATPTNFDSTVRHDFRRPPQSVAPELLVPTTRYGSNVNKSKPAVGAVPDVPKWKLQAMS